MILGEKEHLECPIASYTAPKSFVLISVMLISPIPENVIECVEVAFSPLVRKIKRSLSNARLFEPRQREIDMRIAWISGSLRE